MVMRAVPYRRGPETSAFVMERGGIYLRPGSPFWAIRFRYKGRLIRESTKLASSREALAYLKRRLAEFGLGRGDTRTEVPTLGEAAEALLTHIRASNKSGHTEVRSHLRSLIAHFGASMRIPEILPDRMEKYVTVRRSAGLKDASVYNEMSTLRRCLRLQWRRHHFLALPSFPMPTKGCARQGFFTSAEVGLLCRHLPPHAVNAVRFAWETGWRRGEIFGLRWQDVNLKDGTIFLSVSKNGEPRQLPFGDSEVLARIIREQRASASAFELRSGMPVMHVFHYAGRHLPEGLKRCWKSACQRAGMESRLFHDLHRSFIQRCEDLNVSRSSAMKITGDKTEAVYARYAIAPRASLSAALRRLSEGELVEREFDGAKGKRQAQMRRGSSTL